MKRGRAAVGVFVLVGNAVGLFNPAAPLWWHGINLFFMGWGGWTISTSFPKGVRVPVPPADPAPRIDRRAERRARRAAELAAWEAEARAAVVTYNDFRKDKP